MPDRIVINTGPVLAIIAGTGSLNILSKLYDEIYIPSIKECIQKMRSQGIWLSDNVIRTALKETGEE